MKYRPILFSGPMVRAILEGRKTQTRRQIKLPGMQIKVPSSDVDRFRFYPIDGQVYGLICPYGAIGDRLWVRETFAPHPDGGHVYRATDPDWQTTDGWAWRPSIHMPRAASRILLEVSDIKIERLNEISRDDARAEGVFFSEAFDGFVTDDDGRNFHYSDPTVSFQKLWSGINGPESWAENPWVWVIKFNRIKP